MIIIHIVYLKPLRYMLFLNFFFDNLLFKSEFFQNNQIFPSLY